MKSGVFGMDELISKLNKFGKDAEKVLKAEVAGSGYDIVYKAKVNASNIVGAPPEVKQSISFRILEGGLTAQVYQNALPMGAYIEFGTGVFVRVAPEWKDLAWQFYVNGKGRLRAQPYMYPAYIEGRDKFLINVRKTFENLSNKFNK